MSIVKFVADMDLEIIDITDSENTDETEVVSTNETLVIDASEDETQINNEEGAMDLANEKQNEQETRINWDLLEMEPDNEEVETKKQSKEGGHVLLLEAGPGSIVLSDGEEDLDMIDNLGSEVREKGDDDSKVLGENTIACSSESRVGIDSDVVLKNSAITVFVKEGESEKLELQLVSVGGDKETEIENLELQLGKDSDVIENSDGGSESEKMEVQLVSVGGDMEMGIQNMEGLNENSALAANDSVFFNPREADVNLMGSSGNSVVSCIDSLGGSEKIIVGSILAEKDQEMGNENMEVADADVDLALKGSVNGEVLIENGKTVFTESKDECEKDIHDKLSLEGAIANASAVRGDSGMNSSELVLDTGVQNTDISTDKKVEISRDQTEKTEPVMENANTDFSWNSGSSNNVGQIQINNELETADLGSGINTPKRRGRPRKSKGGMNDGNTDSVLVFHDAGETSNSLVKRKRKDSKYLSYPYTSSQPSPKRPKRDDYKELISENVVLCLISTAQSLLRHNDSKFTKASRGFLAAFRDYVRCKETVKASQEVSPMPNGQTVNVQDCRSKELHQGYIHKEPASLLVKFRPGVNVLSREGLIAKFTKFGALIQSETDLMQDGKSARITFARKKDGQAAFDSINRSDEFETTRLRLGSPIEVAVAPLPMLLDARHKLEEIIAALNGSGLEDEGGLIGEARGLLEKINLSLTKEGTRGTEVEPTQKRTSAARI